LIEISNASAEVTKKDRELSKLKQKYQALADELNIVRDELEKERKERENEKDEVESAKQELSNFKARYREENRKMNEAIQERTHMQQELDVEREKVARQQILIDDKIKNQNLSITQMESEFLEEKNALKEDVAKWRGLFQKLQKEGADKIQAFQDAEFEKAEQERNQFKIAMRAEMEKRINFAVEQAVNEERSNSKGPSPQMEKEWLEKKMLLSKMLRNGKGYFKKFNVKLPKESEKFKPLSKKNLKKRETNLNSLLKLKWKEE